MKRWIVSGILVVAMVFLLAAPNVNTGNASTANASFFNDRYYSSQWYLDVLGMEKAWGEMGKGKKVDKLMGQVRVALVDSGIDANHPDLKGRILKELGYNFVENTRNTTDILGHGTQLAGIIAAAGGNRKGVVGIAGNANVKIIPVKVLDKNGNGRSDIVAKGIIYGVDTGADIINVSIDFKTRDREIAKALEYARSKKVLVVVAAGNSATNCDVYSPAGDDGSFTVASVNSKSIRSSFSSYGTSIAVAAPGEDIYTTTLNGKYVMADGTSMSAPIVAGVAALVKLKRPDLGSDGIRKILTATASDAMNKGWDKYTGYGVVNAFQAIKLASTYAMTDKDAAKRENSIVTWTSAMGQ